MTQSRLFLTACLRDKPLLAKAIIAFNRGLPGRLSAHSLPKALLPLKKRLEDSPAAASRLSRHNHNLCAPGTDPDAWGAQNWIVDFTVPRHRLALLPAPLLYRLADWFGLARFREEVARLIRREEVLALRAAVGENGHTFALRRCLLLPNLRHDSLNVLPMGDGAARPLPERIRHAGFMAVAACLSDAEPALPCRLAATMPSDFASYLLQSARSDAETAAAASLWILLRTLIVKEVAPEWEPCFT